MQGSPTSSFENLLLESHRLKYACKHFSNTSHPTKEAVRYYILPLLQWLEVHHLDAVNRDENHPEAVSISR
jgi:hypothetical protein